jgi:DNA-binding beta-propeller fold protein YncE
VTSDSAVYVADFYNHRVMKWAADATAGALVAGTGSAGNHADRLTHPKGVHVEESTGELFVADRNNNRVMGWAPGATQGRLIAGYGTAGAELWQLNHPADVVLVGTTFYVVDDYNHRLVQWIHDEPGWGVYGG